MKSLAHFRRVACVIAAICIIGLLCLFWANGVMEPWLVLVPVAPFVMLAIVALRTGSAVVAQAASALMVVFGLLAGGRVAYSLLGYDHWLVLPLLFLGAWETAFVSALLLAWRLAAWVRSGGPPHKSL